MTFISQDHAAISNLRVFERERTVKDYRAYTGLQQAELAIISQIKAELSGKKILDVGVGAGRTTDALLEISKDYLGIDISLPMIKTCRSRFPSASFEVCDVRDLSRFGDRAFDLLFFSHNGLDYVGHADRLRALGEIHRVLMEAGVFAFSSHNRRSMRKAPWHSAQLPWRMNPLRHPRVTLKGCLRQLWKPSTICIIGGTSDIMMSLLLSTIADTITPCLLIILTSTLKLGNSKVLVFRR